MLFSKSDYSYSSVSGPEGFEEPCRQLPEERDLIKKHMECIKDIDTETA